MARFQVRAAFTADTVRVYQAYSPEIAWPALTAQRFVSPFKRERMTWIKPSFNWMMYRSGYAAKLGQEVVLGIDLTRAGFEWALANAVISSFKAELHGTPEQWQELVRTRPVRIQWDPERDWRINPVDDVRSIQIGLTGDAVRRYVDEWTVKIEDVTPLAHAVSAAREKGGRTLPADLALPVEMPYPVPAGLNPGGVSGRIGRVRR